jgi:hypothetical protein
MARIELSLIRESLNSLILSGDEHDPKYIEGWNDAIKGILYIIDYTEGVEK